MIRNELFRNRVTGRPAALTALVRIVAGVVFLLFGILKFVRYDAEVAEFVRYGFTDPGVVVGLVGVLEVVGGLMVVAGLGTRIAALGLAVDMIGATAGPVRRRSRSLATTAASIRATVGRLRTERGVGSAGRRPETPRRPDPNPQMGL